MAFCKNCGKELGEGLKFCTECGSPVTAPEAATPPPYQPPTPPQQPIYPPYQPSYQQQPAPVDDKPLSVGSYIAMMILFAIPVIGLILCIVWALSKNENVNRRNFSKALLILKIIGVILTVITLIISVIFGGAVFAAVADEFDLDDFDFGDYSDYGEFVDFGDLGNGYKYELVIDNIS